MYAVLDIETTGGQYNQEGITEIAIYKFDGTEVIDQFISLVNPEIPIQPFVVKLTGINNAMLRLAPKFFEIAKRIVEITEDCIIVAHNADFDYRILKMEFRRLGYNFSRASLCTVELSKKLLPDAASYSLGKLSRSLGIPIPDRHRASGDAMATVKLFKLLLDRDKEKEILKTLIKTEIYKGLMQKWVHILDGLPSSVGVFYILNEKGDIIYLGKSTNIYKKVSQLFTGTSRICKRIQNEVFRVKFEETGNELISTLKEREEINILKPTLNVGQRKSPFLWGLYSDKLKTGSLQLMVSKLDGRKKEIRAFKNIQDANEFLAYTLKKIGLDVFSENEERNTIITNFIHTEQAVLNNVLIVLKGRKVNEKSALWMCNGILQGYCFFDLNYQITTPEVLKNIIIPLQHTREAINFIKYHLQRRKDYKLIHL